MNKKRIENLIWLGVLCSISAYHGYRKGYDDGYSDVKYRKGMMILRELEHMAYDLKCIIKENICM